jgi:NitT/TauT family transport system substrate-binding protein
MIKAILHGLIYLAVLFPTFSGYLLAAQMYAVWTSEAGVYAPVWVTKEAGLFEKHGNQVQLIFIQGATSAAASLISGDAHIAFMSPQVAITSTMKGLDLVMIARLGNFIENQIFGRKGITSLKQIKSLAVSRFGSSADFVGRVLVEREGLKPDSEVAFLQFGNQSGRLAAIETGRADAAIVTPPITLQARKMGFPLLADGMKLQIPYSSNMMVVRRSYLEKNREAVRNALKAMIEGIHSFKTNKEQTIKVISKYMKIQDREVAEEKS